MRNGRREILQALGVLVAGAITPAWARPLALACNMGTTGMIVSASLTPMASAVSTSIVCSTVERWL